MVTLNMVQNGSSVCAVYDLTDLNDSIDEISLFMINNNQKSLIGLAPIRVEAANGVNRKMSFDITGRIALKEYVSHMLSQWQFRDIMLNLINAIQNLDEYMIDINQILLDYNNVYINQLDLSVSFICIALCNFSNENSLVSFFRSVVERSNVIASSNEKDYFHCVWNVIRNESGFSLDNLKKALLSGSVDNMPVQGLTLPKQMPTPSISVDKNNGNTSTQFGMNEKQTNTHASSNSENYSMQSNAMDSFENVSTVTVAPTPKPVPDYVIYKPAVSDTNAVQKKTGLLGRLLGKKTESVTGGKPSTGGLSKFKNGGVASLHSTNSNNQSVSDSITSISGSQFGSQQFPVANNVPSAQSQPSSNNVGRMIENHSAGTTVLNSMTFQGGVTLEDVGTNVLGNSNVQGADSSSVQKSLTLEKKQENVPVQNTVNQSGSFPAQPSVPVMGYTGSSNISQSQNFMNNRNNYNNSVLASTNYGETTVLDSGMSGETTVLSPSQLEPVPTAFLLRLKYNERVPITGDDFRIGKERSTVSYFISDNTAVSRNHASIIVKNCRFYVVDHNSTNHTYVNGKLIPSNVEVEIVNGMKIRFANEEFEFKIS